jgi:homoserine dehydrogenase
MKQVNIAILGFGTVGTGVARLLLDNGDILRDRIGCGLKLKYVADIDMETDRGLSLPPGVMIPRCGQGHRRSGGGHRGRNHRR